MRHNAANRPSAINAAGTINKIIANRARVSRPISKAEPTNSAATTGHLMSGAPGSRLSTTPVLRRGDWRDGLSLFCDWREHLLN